jgi:hypothetical protein
MKNIFLVFLFTILFSLSTVAYSHCGIPENHAKATDQNTLEDDSSDEENDEEKKEKDNS